VKPGPGSLDAFHALGTIFPSVLSIAYVMAQRCSIFFWKAYQFYFKAQYSIRKKWHASVWFHWYIGFEYHLHLPLYLPSETRTKRGLQKKMYIVDWRFQPRNF